jgi:hypothetical protein
MTASAVPARLRTPKPANATCSDFFENVFMLGRTPSD